MPHVLEFEIDGLAGRRGTIAQTLNRHVNLFYGSNGCGKTSLLRVLHGALQCDAGMLASVPFRNARVVIENFKGTQSYVYRLSKTGLTTAGERLPRRRDLERPQQLSWILSNAIAPSWTVEPSTPPPFWRHQYLPTTRMLSGIERSRAHTGTEQELEDYANKVFKDVVEREWLQLFSRAQAQIRKVQEDGLATLLLDVLREPGENAKPDATEARTAYRRATSFLQRLGRSDFAPRQDAFARKYTKSPLVREIMSHIDEVETRIEGVLRPFETFAQQINSLFTAGKTFQASADGLEIRLEDGTKIDIGALSSGEKQLIRMLMAAVAAGTGPIIIDEPELSMHIDWQRVFVQTLRAISPAAQLIAATHSPEVLADVEDRFIFQI